MAPAPLTPLRRQTSGRSLRSLEQRYSSRPLWALVARVNAHTFLLCAQTFGEFTKELALLESWLQLLYQMATLSQRPPNLTECH
jgi:hypothetical protein